MKTTDERTSSSSPFGEKVVKPAQQSDKPAEQWTPTGTSGYVRNTVTGAIKPIAPGSPT